MNFLFLQRRICFLQFLRVWILIFFAINVNAQNTFNIRTTYGFNKAVFTSILDQDSFILVSGIYKDSIDPWVKTFFAKVKNDGTLVKIHPLVQNSLECWNPLLIQLSNGKFYRPCYWDYFNTSIVLYDFETDSTLVHNYKHPTYPDSLICLGKGGDTLSGGKFFMLSSVPGSTESEYDGMITVVDSLGTILKQNILVSPNYHESGKIVRTQKDKVLVGYWKTNKTTVADFTEQSTIHSYDLDGNFLDSYNSPKSEYQSGALDMFSTDDGGMVVASGYGKYDLQLQDVYYQPYIYKVGANKIIQWRFISPWVIDNYAFDKFSRVFPLADGSIIGAGVVNIPGVQFEGFDISGYLVKLNPEGELIWRRRLSIVESAADYHDIFDCKQTSDGGFILCGEAKDLLPGPGAGQKGWLIKLDSFGCLVPGCELLDAKETDPEPVKWFSTFPNPVVDDLALYLGTQNAWKINECTWKVFDLSGNLIKTFPANADGQTYLVNTDTWANGLYFVGLYRSGQLLQMEKVVVQKN